jgi:replicative DNA helicase
MKLSHFIEKLEKEIVKTSQDVDKIEDIERLKETAKRYEGDDAVISSEELVERIKNRPEELKLKSGFSGIDRLLDGFRLQQLITLTAATGSGKTTMAMELTIRLKEYNPMWIPFEEGAEELINKFLERNEDPPLFFTPEHIIDKTLEWVEQKIVESIAKYNTKVIFIDHLHFIVPFTTERHDLAVGRTMRELKGLAKKWNICIFIICHLKKTQVTEKPNIDDLRDSSFIGQESDSVIMLWRATKRTTEGIEITNDVVVSVQKNRRTGRTGNIKMTFKDGRFYEQDWQHQQDY